jgi:hypothetical protein
MRSLFMLRGLRLEHYLYFSLSYLSNFLFFIVINANLEGMR